MLQFLFQIDDAVVTGLVTKLPLEGDCYYPTYEGVSLSDGHLWKGAKLDDVFLLERIPGGTSNTRYNMIIQPEPLERAAYIALRADMPVERMLTLSTTHITVDTCNKYLAEQAYASSSDTLVPQMTVYGKARRRYFIPLIDGIPERMENGDESLPADLLTVLKLAVSQQFEWLAFDADGSVLATLPTYPRGE